MKGNKEFTADFFKSFGPVFKVAAALKRKGFDVSVPPPDIRPHESERMKYMDEGDIRITMHVEVKQRSITFSGPKDYPFKTVFINEEYKLRPDTFMYVILSADGENAAIIQRHTKQFWETEEIYDKHQKRKCKNKACPVEHVVFMKI